MTIYTGSGDRGKTGLFSGDVSAKPMPASGLPALWMNSIPSSVPYLNIN